MKYLRRVNMSKLQSWGSDVGITMEFTEGLNILVADNSVGKSVFIKVLEHIVKEPKRTRAESRQIITFGKERGDIGMEFSDGTLYYIQIYENMCVYYMERGDYVTRDAETVRDNLFKDLSLIIEPNSGFIANIIKADQGKFLVSTASKSNEKLLNTITKNAELEKLIAECQERIVILNGSIVRINSRLRSIDNKLEGAKFVDTEVLEDSVEIETNLLYLVETTYYLGAILSPVKEDIEESYVQDLALFKELKKLNSITEEIREYDKPPINDRDTMLTLRELYKLTDIVKPVEGEINPIEVQALKTLQTLNKELDVIREKTEEPINDMELRVLKTLNSLSIVEKFEEKTFNVKPMDLKANQVFTDLEKALTPVIRIANSLERLKGEIKNLSEEYTEIIEEQKDTGYECPVCGSVGLLKEKSNHFLREIGVLGSE